MALSSIISILGSILRITDKTLEILANEAENLADALNNKTAEMLQDSDTQTEINRAENTQRVNEFWANNPDLEKYRPARKNRKYK